jgi:GrpB-like predicted nucleotidyltransferase (UPF0157 family)
VERDERVLKVASEPVAIVPYDPQWPLRFEQERTHLRSCLPHDLIGRIEHFGSTAVPGLAAKPVIDMLIEVSDLGEARRRIAPILEAQGYEYFWRPTLGDDGPPFYAWLIKRDAASGERTHHLHMVERTFHEHWERLRFRDYLIGHPEAARKYEDLKLELAKQHPDDRVSYTRGKTRFIEEIMAELRRSDE